MQSAISSGCWAAEWRPDVIDFIVKYWVQVAFDVICSGMGTLAGAFLLWRKKQKALEHGVQALLRSQIIQTCEHYLDAGDIPLYGLENIENMYSAYHTLGGNGAVTKMVGDTRELPTRH